MLKDNSNWRIAHSDAVDVKALSELFLVQQNSLSAVKLLCRLSKAIQRHRGASIACLDGDISFAPVVLKLQLEVKKFLAAMQQFNQAFPDVVDEQCWQAIMQEWNTIVSGWKEDHPVQNYEFHCHLIEQIRKTLRDLMSSYLLQPLTDQESNFRVEFESALIAITDTIEQIARLRGISTHIASSKKRDNDLYVRMEFLIKVVPQETSALYHTLQEMDGTSMRISGLNHLALQQNRIQTLISDIQSGLVDVEPIVGDSQDLFEQATIIIDTYWQILDQIIVSTEDSIYQSFATT